MHFIVRKNQVDDRDIETQQNIAVASRRVAFTQVMTPVGTGEETIGNGYNLTS